MDARDTPGMIVYLVPVGGSAHELYCETDAASDRGQHPVDRSTLWGRLAGVFYRLLDEGDAERRHPGPPGGPAPRRLRRAATRRLAETVAEQRLLWHLRRETAARLVHADTLPADRALALARGSLTRDWRRHLRWCVVDALLAVACLPIALLPGPNVLAYYFLVRGAGHYFSLRGARHGLDAVTWTPDPSPHLASLGALRALDPAGRARRIREVADALGLNDLPQFLDRPRRRAS